MKWDVFCRVIDNHGDLGVCWRLAADLAGRGERVRLWVDDASALTWMAPAGAHGVDVLPWPTGGVDAQPGDVVVEAFGCELPPQFVARMAACAPQPLWINLEYLSAEAYVERCHGLPSPQSLGSGAGMVKWFFYPGFSAATGGLLREPGLLQRRDRFDAAAWLAAQRIQRREGERVVSLFCYENAALPAVLETLSASPTLLLAAPGEATRQVAHALGPGCERGELRAHPMPYLTQVDFDHLLWACDLNIVRGEDSFVRAQWAGAPFLWQVYPQADGAHEAKLDAFLDRHLAGAHGDWALACRELWRHWNGFGGASAWPDVAPWQAHCRAWRERLAEQPDLCSQLLRFAREKG